MTEDHSVIFDLDAQRKALEEEASAITSELTTSLDGKEPMGISTPLVDKDGYPRADVDVYRARHLRKRLNEIRFDHDAIMKKIEEHVFQNSSHTHHLITEEKEARKKRKPKPKFDPVSGKWVVCNWDGTVSGIENGHLRSFDEIGRERETTNNISNSTVSSPDDVLLDQNTTKEQQKKKIEQRDPNDEMAFARVGVIMLGSPAQEAGLKEDDLIVKFGTVDCTNHRNLQALTDIVQNAHSDGNGISLIVLRKESGDYRILHLNLRPKEWSGKGLIGCTFEFWKKSK